MTSLSDAATKILGRGLQSLAIPACRDVNEGTFGFFSGHVAQMITGGLLGITFGVATSRSKHHIRTMVSVGFASAATVTAVINSAQQVWQSEEICKDFIPKCIASEQPPIPEGVCWTVAGLDVALSAAVLGASTLIGYITTEILLQPDYGAMKTASSTNNRRAGD